MTHILEPLVKRLASRRHLDGDDRAAILALPHDVQSFATHKTIVREGEHPAQCCLLLSGFAHRSKIVADGARQILAVQVPGDMVDLQNSWLERADHDVQTLTPVEVAFIPRSALQTVAFERPAVGKAIWIETLVDGSVFREWIANVGRRNATQRVAHILCEFGLRLEAAGLGTSAQYELPMTQDQLADAVGLTSVHVNRTLKALDQAGLTLRTKRSISIVDWKKLAAIGDFDPLYLHLQQHLEVRTS